jgi:hypothetical protein
LLREVGAQWVLDDALHRHWNVMKVLKVFHRVSDSSIVIDKKLCTEAGFYLIRFIWTSCSNLILMRNRRN